MNKLKCNNCNNETFLVNGWMVTEELIEDEIIEAYDKDDIEKADIIEVICEKCNEAHMTVTGGEI